MSIDGATIFSAKPDTILPFLLKRENIENQAMLICFILNLGLWLASMKNENLRSISWKIQRTICQPHFCIIPLRSTIFQALLSSTWVAVTRGLHEWHHFSTASQKVSGFDICQARTWIVRNLLYFQRNTLSIKKLCKSFLNGLVFSLQTLRQ